jgi:hypothetical protein
MQVNHPNVRSLLDTYHMNIEEVDFEKAFLGVQNCLEGPDPFRADKGETTPETIGKHAQESLAKLKERFA